jgi:hypothetical protein
MGHHIVKNKSWLNAKVFYEKIYQKISGHAMICDDQSTQPKNIMNIANELNFEEMLRIKLEVLRRTHRDLDDTIAALELPSMRDQLTLRRLKKQKLVLKDHISEIFNQLTPNIIA